MAAKKRRRRPPTGLSGTDQQHREFARKADVDMAVMAATATALSRRGECRLATVAMRQFHEAQGRLDAHTTEPIGEYKTTVASNLPEVKGVLKQYYSSCVRGASGRGNGNREPSVGVAFLKAVSDATNELIKRYPGLADRLRAR